MLYPKRSGCSGRRYFAKKLEKPTTDVDTLVLFLMIFWLPLLQWEENLNGLPSSVLNCFLIAIVYRCFLYSN